MVCWKTKKAPVTERNLPRIKFQITLHICWENIDDRRPHVPTSQQQKQWIDPIIFNPIMPWCLKPKRPDSKPWIIPSLFPQLLLPTHLSPSNPRGEFCPVTPRCRSCSLPLWVFIPGFETSRRGGSFQHCFAGKQTIIVNTKSRSC